MLIFGKNSCLEYLKSGNNFISLKYQKGIKLDDKLKEILSLSNVNNPRVSNQNFSKVGEYPKQKLDQLSNNSNHQGIILEVEDYAYYSIQDILDSSTNRILILDHIHDPQNFGSIIRNAAAFNYDFIVIPKDRSVGVNATVYKVASGSLNIVKIVQATNLVSTIHELKNAGFWTVGLDMNNELEVSELNYDKDDKVALVLGNEGSGISNLVTKNLDQIARIDYNASNIESLNVASASAIAMYIV